MNLGDRLRKTRDLLASRLGALFGSGSPGSEELEKLEEALLEADLGWRLTERVTRDLPGICSARGVGMREGLALLLESMLPPAPGEDHGSELRVIMTVGVNGSGKTTTVARLAAMYRERGHMTVMACADTFRAAAGEQLAQWGRKLDIPVVVRPEGTDPGAVAYDAVASARARGFQRLILDTAGRLPNRKGLLDELSKVHRVTGKALEGAPHEVLLVLDGSVGQNALLQAEGFSRAVPVTGLVVTKLDGTAKGGAVFAMAHETAIPIRYIGTGEGGDDFSAFDPVQFTRALVGLPEDGDAVPR